MKFKLILLFIVLLSFGCNSNKKFFDSGAVQIDHVYETIGIKIINDLPFCNVTIGTKEYQFLIDTGAPTIISEETFNALKLQESHSQIISDSQNNKQKEKFAVLPELKMGNLVFKNIGCAVLQLDSQEFKCYGIDGIIGANMLSKLHWKMDYQNNTITASKDLSLFNVEAYDFSMRFNAKNQKTPIVQGKLNNKALYFTFDTGFSGNIKVPNNYLYYKDIAATDKFVTKMGINSIGAFGKSESDKTFEMKYNVVFDNLLFENELIDSGKSTLIGNEFLKNYIYVLDWRNNKIYFKKNKEVQQKKIEGFGFSYLFIDGQPKVLSKIEDRNVPIELGDIVLKINDTDFTTIDTTDICNLYLNKVEKNENQIEIKVKRAKDTLNFTLKKQVFIK